MNGILKLVNTFRMSGSGAAAGEEKTAGKKKLGGRKREREREHCRVQKLFVRDIIRDAPPRQKFAQKEEGKMKILFKHVVQPLKRLSNGGGLFNSCCECNFQDLQRTNVILSENPLILNQTRRALL